VESPAIAPPTVNIDPDLLKTVEAELGNMTLASSQQHGDDDDSDI
jgi:hypothetical protein